MDYRIHLRDRDIFVAAQQAEYAARLLESYGFDPAYDEDNNITDLDFIGRDMHKDEDLYQLLAPLMWDGSYLEFFGEMGDIWRWVFYGGECYKIKAIELWADPAVPPSFGQEVLNELDRYLLAA